MVAELEKSVISRCGKDHIFLGAGWEVRCVAHVINLIAQDFIKALHKESISDEEASRLRWWERENHVDVIERVRLLCLWVRGSPLRQQEWLALASPRINRKSIRYDVQTRWNSTCRMLEDAQEMQVTFDLYTHQQPQLRHLALSKNEWVLLGDVVKVLRRFKTLTNLVSEAEPQLTVVMGIYYDLQDLLQEASDGEGGFKDIAPAVQRAAATAMSKHHKYYENSCGP